MTMKVLVLEDNNDKYENIKGILDRELLNCTVERCSYYSEFVRLSCSEKYNFVVTDLLVPMQKNSIEAVNVTEEVIGTIRDTDCINFSTPVIAITSFNDVAEQNYEKFNRLDINIVNYKEGEIGWENAFINKAKTCIPPVTYDFIIFCALEKEAEAFLQLDYNVGNAHIFNGLNCRTISIDNKSGVIVTPPRMGLVNAAITCTRAIESFRPKLICMSGICAGIAGQSNIYDVIISEMCHQHDSGKWTTDGFVSIPYSVQLLPQTLLDIKKILSVNEFHDRIKDGIVLKKDEFPGAAQELEFCIRVTPTSSGSSVIASESALTSIKEQHSKQASFEMESYALYESARQAPGNNLRYFSAKSVVDNGDELKSDKFHRVACLLSAKTVYELIRENV